MAKHKGKAQAKAAPQPVAVHSPLPKRQRLIKPRVYVRGVKGEATPGTKTDFRRQRRSNPTLTRKAFLSALPQE